MKSAIFSIFLTMSGTAFSCSFGDAVETFTANGRGGIVPDQPNFVVVSISRGSSGDEYSCSDAGAIRLKLDPEPREPTGYIFSIKEGHFEDGLFDKNPIIRIKDFTKPGEYSFYWLDGNSDIQEPIDITVEIIAISSDGGRSSPQLLKIKDPGKRPWWQFW